MKLNKYTFTTPVFGSIECEELLSDTDGRIELSPMQMCRLYTEDDKLARFLTENMEDLAWCVPEELRDTVLRAEFGDFAMLGGTMYLRTYIWVRGHLTDEGIVGAKHWISGQMSDGWGEGLEQKPWKEERVRKPVMYFNEWSLEFEEDQELCEVSYYVNPWNTYDFEVMLEDVEEVEEATHLEIVANITLPHHSRQVIKLRPGLDLRVFLMDFGQEHLAQRFETLHPQKADYLYLVRDPEGNSGIEIMPKCVYERGSFCYLYDMTLEDSITETRMPVSIAILELLK